MRLQACSMTSISNLGAFPEHIKWWLACNLMKQCFVVREPMNVSIIWPLTLSGHVPTLCHLSDNYNRNADEQLCSWEIWELAQPICSCSFILTTLPLLLWKGNGWHFGSFKCRSLNATALKAEGCFISCLDYFKLLLIVMIGRMNLGGFPLNIYYSYIYMNNT